MSRRRREQKDRKRELARQMGVKPGDAPDELREKLRVTRLELRAESVEIVQAPFALRPPPLLVDVAVALLEPQGARWLATVRATAEGKAKTGARLALRHESLADDRVRYTRPATLLLVATIAGEAPLADRPIGEVRAALDGEVDLTDAALRRLKAPAATTFHGVAGGIAVFAVPHRLKETVDVPIDEDKRRLTVRVDICF